MTLTLVNGDMFRQSEGDSFNGERKLCKSFQKSFQQMVDQSSNVR